MRRKPQETADLITFTEEIHNTRFFYKKNFYKKMSLKNPKTLRKS